MENKEIIKTTDPILIQQELSQKTKSKNVLTFDHITGELIVSNQRLPESPKNVVVDQIYKDGFFVN